MLRTSCPLTASRTSTNSPQASDSRCRALPCRPMRCCWRNWPNARRRPAAPPPSSPPTPTTPSAWSTKSPSSRPNCACALLPDWETLPYDSFSPHQDLISERLATLQAHQPESGRRGAGARHHRAVPAGAAGLPGRLHLLLQAAARSCDENASSRPSSHWPATATSAQVVRPGEYSGARRADRPVPDGLARAVPDRPVRRRDRHHPHLRPRHPAQPVPGAGSAPAAGPRVPDGRRRPRALPQPLARTARGRPDQAAGSTRTWATASPPPASSTTCRCSSRKPPPCSTTWAPARHGGAARRHRAGLPAFLAGHRPALPPGAGRPRTAGAAAGGAVPERRAVLPARQAARAAGDPRRGTPSAPIRRVRALPARSRSMRGADDPLVKLKAHIRSDAAPRAAAAPRATAGARACSTSCAPAALQPPPAFDSLRRVPRRPDEKIGIADRRCVTPASRCREQGNAFVTETELYAGTAPGHRRRNASRNRPATSRRWSSDLTPSSTIGDPVVHTRPRHRPLSRPGHMDLGQGSTPRASRCSGVPAPGVRRQGQALRAGVAAAPDQPLHRRRAGRRAAAQAGLRPVGQGQAQGRRAGARHRRRAAATSTPGAPRARAMPSAYSAPRLRGLRRGASASTKRPTRRPRSMP